MVHLLEDCNLCAIHAKRVTISAGVSKDVHTERASGAVCLWILDVCVLTKLGAAGKVVPEALATADEHVCGAVPKDLQLARRIRGPIAGVSSY